MITPTFFFYDLETSGRSPRDQRIMQFAGVRTDMDLQPIGEPTSVYIRLSEDVLAEPDAILITGITPQKTWQEGLSEAEFMKLFYDEVALPGTIFVGYNSVRFDDEFMRFLHWRNFYDAYEWQWTLERSRWDMLDVVRMTRALRPDGIKWPFAPDGKPTVSLPFMTSINKIDHQNAHDALSDVRATLALAQLVREKQPKLFEFLLKYRGKKQVEKLVAANAPFVYSSGKYPNEYLKTTVVVRIAEHPQRGASLVYDLRIDPSPYFSQTPAQIAEAWQPAKYDENAPRFPVKTLKYNRCPAVAPINVLDADSRRRLQLDDAILMSNIKKLGARPDFTDKLIDALAILEKRRQTELLAHETDVDGQLYDDFVPEADRTKLRVVQACGADDFGSLKIVFKDDRLNKMLPLYKARNFPKQLSDEERAAWEAHCQRKLLLGGNSSPLAKFFDRLSQLAAQDHLTDEQRYLLDELQLYAQSIMPEASA